jgi:hypothetical protein
MGPSTVTLIMRVRGGEMAGRAQRIRCAAVQAFCLATGLARFATAQPEQNSVRVDVVLVASCARDATLATRIKTWFGASAISVKVASTLATDEILAPRPWPGVRVWCTQPALGRARLYFVVSTEPGLPPRFLVRDIELPTGLDELGQERVAEVVRASSLALWEGSASTPADALARSLDRGRDERNASIASAPRRAGGSALPRPAASKRTRLRFSASFGAGVTGRGHEGVAVGPALELAVGLAGAAAVPELAVGGRHWLPWHTSAAPGELRLDGEALRGWLRWTLPAFARGAVEVGCGAGADWIAYQPGGVPESTWVAGRGEREIRPVATLLLGGKWWLGQVMSVRAQGEAAFQLSRTHYDVEEPSGRREVLVPWRVQPGIVVLVGYDTGHR